MSDSESELDPLETLERKHRKDKKELQSKITKLRHSIGKNDKNRKKEVNAEIDRLESEQRQQHEREMHELKMSQATVDAEIDPSIDLRQSAPSINKSTTSLSSSSSSSSTENDESQSQQKHHQQQKQQRMSKASRRRENKERKIREMMDRIKAGQVDDSENDRLIEMKLVEDILQSRGLNVYEIPSDGDCMYKSIEHQMQLTRNRVYTVEELRTMASDYIRVHKDEFMPFLTINDAKEFDEFCDKIANTHVWGGNLELKALSSSLKVPIEVIQAEGNFVKIGFDEFIDGHDPLILCYFQRAYQLGQHYNSVIPNNEDADEDEWTNDEKR